MQYLVRFTLTPYLHEGGTSNVEHMIRVTLALSGLRWMSSFSPHQFEADASFINNTYTADGDPVSTLSCAKSAACVAWSVAMVL